MNRPCFIYAITNLVTGRRYVGSTLNPTTRWGEHRSALKHKRHHCQYLQNSWNKHGAISFSFAILKELLSNDKPARVSAEISEIAAMPSFNNVISSGDLLNFENSPQTRARISAGLLKSHEKDPERRVRHSAIMLQKFSDPEYKAKHVALTRAAQTPEVRKKRSDGVKASWASGTRSPRIKRETPEEESARKSELMRIFWASDKGQEAKARRTKRFKELWADPTSKMHTRVPTRLTQTSEEKEKRSKTLTSIWADPSSSMHTRKNGRDDPKARENLSSSLKAAWDRPGARERRSQINKEAWARRKTEKLNPD